MYDNVKEGSDVIFKEGRHVEKCVVESIKVEGDLKYFKLRSRSGKCFTVSVNEKDGTMCPWRFLTDTDSVGY